MRKKGRDGRVKDIFMASNVVTGSLPTLPASTLQALQVFSQFSATCALTFKYTQQGTTLSKKGCVQDRDAFEINVELRPTDCLNCPKNCTSSIGVGGLEREGEKESSLSHPPLPDLPPPHPKEGLLAG